MGTVDWQKMKLDLAVIFILLGIVVGGCLGIGSVWYMVEAHPGELIPVLIAAAATFGFTVGVALTCFLLVKRWNPQLAIAALRRILFDPDL